jgi:predicted DNA-binding transcriptional regulator AlpA
MRRRFANNKDTAIYLGVSEMTLWRYKKQIPGFPQPAVISGTERNDLDAIDEYMAANKSSGAPTRGQRAVKNLRQGGVVK